MNSPRVALMGMILESNRYSKPASKAEFESLTWMGGNALMAEARSDSRQVTRPFQGGLSALVPARKCLRDRHGGPHIPGPRPLAVRAAASSQLPVGPGDGMATMIPLPPRPLGAGILHPAEISRRQ